MVSQQAVKTSPRRTIRMPTFETLLSDSSIGLMADLSEAQGVTLHRLGFAFELLAIHLRLASQSCANTTREGVSAHMGRVHNFFGHHLAAETDMRTQQPRGRGQSQLRATRKGLGLNASHRVRNGDAFQRFAALEG